MKKTLALLLLLAGLTMEARAETLTRNGTEDHMTWNTTDNNWLSGTTPATYSDNNDVLFGDEGSGEVWLSGALAPASATVDTGYGYAGSSTQENSFQLPF